MKSISVVVGISPQDPSSDPAKEKLLRLAVDWSSLMTSLRNSSLVTRYSDVHTGSSDFYY